MSSRWRLPRAVLGASVVVAALASVTLLLILRGGFRRSLKVDEEPGERAPVHIEEEGGKSPTLALTETPGGVEGRETILPKERHIPEGGGVEETRGVVLDEAERPVRGAQIIEVGQGGSNGELRLGKRTQSDADGSFCLGSAPDLIVVRHQAYYPERVRVDKRMRRALRVILRAGGRVLVQVATSEGLPLEGAIVRVYQGDSPGEGIFIGTEAERLQLDEYWYAAGAKGLTRQSNSDARGLARIEGLAPGRYFISATAVGYIPVDSPEAVILDEKEEVLREVTLSKGIEIQGLASDLGGRPIERAAVKAFFGGVMLAAESNSTGIFKLGGFPVDSGLGELAVSAEGYALAWFACSIEDLPYEIPLDDHSMDLLVLDSLGAPIAGTLTVEGPLRNEKAVLAEPLKMTLKPINGRIKISHIGTAVSSLRIEHETHLPFIVDLDELKWTGVWQDVIRLVGGDNTILLEIVDESGNSIRGDVKVLLAGVSYSPSGLMLPTSRAFLLAATEEGYRLPRSYLRQDKEMRLNVEFGDMHSKDSILLQPEGGEVVSDVVRVVLVRE